MASPDGEMPLKMTSFLWIQIAHWAVKIRLQSASRLKEPPNKELQNVSSEVTESRATAAPRHASWANGHWKKRRELSSGPLPQRGQLTGESGNMRCRATRVMRRRRRRSHPKIRIFKGMCRFQISLHLCVMYTFSRGSCPHRRRYTALTVNRDCRQTYASLVASFSRFSYLKPVFLVWWNVYPCIPLGGEASFLLKWKTHFLINEASPQIFVSCQGRASCRFSGWGICLMKTCHQNQTKIEGPFKLGHRSRPICSVHYQTVHVGLFEDVGPSINIWRHFLLLPR